MKPPISITQRAQEEIKNIFQKKGIPQDYQLRVSVKGAGCGVSFKLGFDKKRENDDEFEVNGIHVLVRKHEMMFLIGKEIEFYDESDGRGFLFV